MIQTSRRSLITGLVSFLAAPAVVRAASLMPVKALPPELVLYYLGYNIYFDQYDPRMVRLISARMDDYKAMHSWMMQHYYGDPPAAGEGLTKPTT